ncbi:cysteine hydrolase family protein [Nitrospirillum viridazoti]|uniref:Cysteine hydrolase n=1 Tax=Nitrospirillum viridazoti CBAmc TaxID=1441467 RepID=A0A248K3F0_9PROT|nr:cysteine hydrolase family protein [Nitrospirillum amazonense]ASG24958.1 cysteine hydrolase [Nitrospirillum amazonense CBAmc]TWB29967.1 nicotinamidase-related amidase [Nitrospirillum amazonense]
MRPQHSRRSSSALIVLDMQVGLVHGPVPPHGGAGVVVRIQDMADRARKAGGMVVLVQHDGPEGSRAAPGSADWQLVEQLAPQAGDLVVRKSRPSVFAGTELAALLRDHGIGRVVLSGMKTEYCVDASCRAARDLGFEAVLAGDAHTTIDTPALAAGAIIHHHNLTLGGPFAQVMAAAAVGF